MAGIVKSSATYVTDILTDGTLQDTFEQDANADYDLDIATSASASAGLDYYNYNTSTKDTSGTYNPSQSVPSGQTYQLKLVVTFSGGSSASSYSATLGFKDASGSWLKNKTISGIDNSTWTESISIGDTKHVPTAAVNGSSQVDPTQMELQYYTDVQGVVTSKSSSYSVNGVTQT